jgi:hypothetical protein
MASTKLHNLAKVDELERIKTVLDQFSSVERLSDISEVYSQICTDIETVFLVIKSQFSGIQSNLDPEAFMICLNFFDWFSDEFKRLNAFLKFKSSQLNAEYFAKTARSLILQLIRFVDFFEKTSLILRI